MKFISRLKKLFQRGEKEEIISEHHDELYGKWYNWQDDDNGMAMLWGYGLEFMPNNRGESFWWETSKSEELEVEAFVWKRLSEDKVQLRLIADEITESEILDYKITEIKGAYGSTYYQLSEMNKNEFWFCPEPMHKLKKIKRNKT